MAKEIPLTKGHIAIVDDEDYAELMQWKWSYSMGCNDYILVGKLTQAYVLGYLGYITGCQ